MPPIRRYLRISKYSVLECRIYLDNPSDTRWLLNPRDPVLPRIFAAIRPLVVPKLREENERLFAKKKGHPVKDVIAEGMSILKLSMASFIQLINLCEDEFEVALFLRESRTRHSLLTRQKTFEEPDDDKENPVDRSASTAETGILVESDDEAEEPDLHNIPPASADDENETSTNKRPANTPDNQRASKRQKGKQTEPPTQDDEGDEKKLRFRTNYESFNIHGWVLCLLVTRTGDAARKEAPSEPKRQVLMEEWMSTQAQGGLEEE